MKIFFGLLKEIIWFKEYLVSEYIFKNLKPELVEKNEPPIITKYYLIFFMIIGRVELLTLLIILKKFLFKN